MRHSHPEVGVKRLTIKCLTSPASAELARASRWPHRVVTIITINTGGFVKPLSCARRASCCVTSVAHGCEGRRSCWLGSRLPMRLLRSAGSRKVLPRHGARRRWCSARLESRRGSLRRSDPGRGVPNQEGGGQCWNARTGDVFSGLAAFLYCSVSSLSWCECHVLKPHFFFPFVSKPFTAAQTLRNNRRFSPTLLLIYDTFLPQPTEWKLHRHAVLCCIEQFLDNPQASSKLPSNCNINKLSWEKLTGELVQPEACVSHHAPFLLLLDDNFYYPSMRYEVYQLARKCKSIHHHLSLTYKFT